MTAMERDDGGRNAFATSLSPRERGRGGAVDPLAREAGERGDGAR